MITKAELLERIKQLEEYQITLISLMDGLADKTKSSYVELYNAVEAHNVYMAQQDKNIMLLDGMMNKVCFNIGLVIENKRTDLH